MRCKFLKFSTFAVLLALTRPGLSLDVRPETIGYLAFGDLRGYFEPCGCDPEADLGGVLRQIALIERERALNKDLLLFNLGNNLPTSFAETYKVAPLQQALSFMKPVATLFNEQEMRYFSDKKNADKKMFYVLSNSKEKRVGVSEHINHSKAKVFGYFFSGDFKDKLEPASPDLLNKWQKLASDSKLPRILLFSGSGDELAFFVESKWFDYIVSSNTTSFEKVIGPEEKNKPSLLLRMAPDIFMVPVGGQGILRGGKLRFGAAPLLRDILGEKSSPVKLDFATPKLSGLLQASGVPVTWLDKSYRGLSSSLDRVERDYKNAGETRLRALEAERKKSLKNTPFAGSERCASCHEKEYAVWQKSGHAKAFATLEAKSKQNDPECVACHVLGFKDVGGFVSLKESKHFANVQCENCHGPRKAHAEGALEKVEDKAKEVCVSCHVGAHSSQFNFEIYWKKIAH